MKRYITILLSLICILSLTACDKDNTYEINITVPAGNSAAFVYSEEEISPVGIRSPYPLVADCPTH